MKDWRVSREGRRTTSSDWSTGLHHHYDRDEREADSYDGYEREADSSDSYERDRPPLRERRAESPIYTVIDRVSDDEARYRPRRQTRREPPFRYYSDDIPRHMETRETYRARYMPALDQNGKELTIEIDLNTARGSLGILHANAISRQPTSRRLEREKEFERRYNLEKVDRFDILAARRYLMDGRESVILDYRRSVRVDTSTQFRWIHLQSKVRSLENFEHLASRLQGIDESEPILIARLMQKIRDEKEKLFVSGPTLEPVVHRCDGRDPRNPEKEDKWVMFMCIPYLATESLAHETHSDELHLHRTKGLLQSHYRLELTPNLEKEQVMCQYGPKDSNLPLHLPQIWTFILSSGVILTCSPDAFESMLGPSIRFNEANETSSGNVQLQIRMLDPRRRLFFIPLEECRTWFALVDRVVALCGREFGDKIHDYRILRPDGTQIEAVDWEGFYANEKGSFIDITVQCMRPEAPLPPKPARLLRDGNYWSSSSGSDSTDASGDDSPGISDSEHGIPRSPHLKANRRDLEETLTKNESQENRFSPGHATHKGAFVDEPKSLPSNVESMALVPYRKQGSTFSFLRKSTMRSEDRRRSNDQTRDDYRRRGSRQLYLSRRAESPRGHHRAKYPRQTYSSRRPRSPNDTTQSKLVRRLDQDRDSRRRDRHSSPQTALTLHRPHPPEYVPRRSDPPPNRVTRYLLPPPDDVIVNVPTKLAPGNEIEQAYYISHLKKRTEKRRRLREIHEPVSNTQEGNTSGYAAQDDVANSSVSVGDHESQKSGGQRPAKVPKPEVNVPPVFLWPPGNPSAGTNNKFRRQGAQSSPFGRRSSDELPRDPKAPVAAENVKSSSEMNDKETLKVILENVHRDLSKNKDYNLSLISEEKFTQGKLYKAVDVASRAEVTSAMKGLLSHEEQSDVPDSEWSQKSWQAQLNDLANHLLEIFDFFIPADSTELVAGKYWGAMMRLLQIIAKMCEPRFARLMADSENQKADDAWFIIDISKTIDFRIEAPAFRPTEFFVGCEDCRKRTRYRTTSQALEHLRQHHFLSQPVTTDELKRWIAHTRQLWDYQICADAQRLIDTMLQHCIQLQMLKNEICHGVCVDGKFADSLYSLPSGLVKAFQRILILIIYVAHTCSVAYKQYERSHSDTPPLTFVDLYYTHHIEILGYGAEGSFDTAKDDLLLMSGADDYSRGIAYEAVGPEYVVLLLLNDLLARTNAEDALNLHKIYREYAMRLDYQSRHRPRKRLLSKINLFRDELRIVVDVMQQQTLQMCYIADLLQPTSFKATSRRRETLYRLESNVMNKYLDAHARDRDNYGDLQNTVDKLAQRTTQQVEIQQEDHGTAIRVFTIVTIVFLPLSFVTGLLGMNTADIRDQSNGQWLFWAIGLPLTAVVLVLSVLIGYWGDQFRETLEALFSKRHIMPATIVDRRNATHEPDSHSILSADTQRVQAPLGEKRQTENRSAEDNV